jgi:hypothetical protein
MKWQRHNAFLRGLALLAMLLFIGDIALDAVADLSQGHCEAPASQSAPDHEKSPCSHCLCATHSGAVVAADFAPELGSHLQPTDFLSSADEATPTRLATSIDHPPQLA